MKNIDKLNVEELSITELCNIKGGDEPAYGLGYVIGSVFKAIGDYFDNYKPDPYIKMKQAGL